MGKKPYWLFATVALSGSLLLTACGGGGGGPKSSAKAITAFSFSAPAATGIIDQSAKTVSVTVPHGTPVGALIAAFTATGVSVTVNGASQSSGVTENNFTNSVDYVVTAEDSSTATYTVTVSVVAINLPRTGQTMSYLTGDDGDLQKGVTWPNPRFTDNADGTVTDNLTGLMWLTDANCLASNYSGFDGDGTAGDGAVTWQHALDFVAGIDSGTYSGCGGGRTDWRLPNDIELESLVDSSAVGPVLTAGHPFANVQLGWYGSSTTYAGSSGSAWSVHVSYGYVNFPSKTYNVYVWPVRDAAIISTISLPGTGQTTAYATGDDGDLQKGVAWPSQRFTDNADGTVVDNLTGLIWLKDANCMATSYSGFDTDGTAGDGAVTWQHALEFVAGIDSGTYSNCGGGHGDWRLPNRKELKSLIDKSMYSWALPWPRPFANVNMRYWSSTAYAGTAVHAWAVGMFGGDVTNDHRDGTDYVWPVRSGQ